MQILNLSNQHTDRKQAIIMADSLFFIEYKNATQFNLKDDLNLIYNNGSHPFSDFLTAENVELICKSYLKNLNECPDEVNRLFSDDDIDIDRFPIAHITKNKDVMKKLINLMDFQIIKILLGRNDINALDKVELLSHLIDSKPNLDIIRYIAQHYNYPAVIDKLLSQNYDCNGMITVLEYVVTNKNLSDDLYNKIYWSFVKLSTLPDYLTYEITIRYLYSDFLLNEAVPNYLVEMILLSNIRLFTPNEKLEKTLLRKNLPQYMLEYIIASFDGKLMKSVHYDIDQRTRILNLKQRFEHISIR